MWRTLIFVAVLVGLGVSAPSHAAPKEPGAETRRQELQKNQQERLQALTRRGRLSTYQQLLGAGKVRIASSASAAEAASRDAAIDLAALGFTAADVKDNRRRDIDLFDVVHRFFQGVTLPAEAMLMADTIVVATAGQAREKRSRTDGFLADIPFTVAKSLKGSRAAGDVVLIPRNSGPLPNGNYRRDFSDIDFTAGKKYLLVLSKNWYEQFVALDKGKVEISFTALPYDAYEIADNGSLLRRARSIQAGSAPKDLGTVEADLRNLSGRKHKMEVPR